MKYRRTAGGERGSRGDIPVRELYILTGTIDSSEGVIESHGIDSSEGARKSQQIIEALPAKEWTSIWREHVFVAVRAGCGTREARALCGFHHHNKKGQTSF